MGTVTELSELIFAKMAAINPRPKSELNCINEYTFLVAVILSAQTTDKSVNKVTGALFEVANSPAAMLTLGIDGLRGHIKSLGLFNNKARHVVAMSAMLIERFGGSVPHTLKELIGLPGVGRKTAKVFLNSVLGEDCIPVDRHVFRVSRRLGLSASSSVAGVEKDLEEHVSVIYRANAHHWLVLHGRYVCLAVRPKCGECLVREFCCGYNNCGVDAIVARFAKK